MSAQIPPVPDSNPTVGFVDWRDVIDNVRELDLEWLQNRTVVRFDSVGAANSYAGDPAKVPGSLEEGQVVYFIGPKQLAVKTGASTYKYALLSGLLTVADAGAIASISNAGTGGITLPADGSVGVPLLKVAVDRVVADSAGLHLKTGTAVANLTTSATDLVSDIPIQAPVLKAAGAVQAASAAISGAVAAASVAATTASVSGALSAGSLAAAAGIAGLSLNIGSGALVASGAGVTAAGALSTGGSITAASGNITATNGDLRAGTNRGVYTDNLYLTGGQFQWEASTNSIIRNIPGGSGVGAWQRMSGPTMQPAGTAQSGGTGMGGLEAARRYESFIKYGSAVVSFDSDGRGRLNYGSGAFPHETITVMITNASPDLDGAINGAPSRYMLFGTYNTDASGTTISATSVYPSGAFGVPAPPPAPATAVVRNSSFQVNYIAIGW